MATTSLTVKTKKDGAKPCDCGRGAGGGTCCGLDCLVQPRFFCGQLLTDQDLTALVNWTRDKTALSRFRDGWGVVCGLDVRCDPRACDRVVVTPGYAVNCCGDDIVVCAEATLDLAAACRDEEDPCADLRRFAEERYGSLAGFGAGGRAGVWSAPLRGGGANRLGGNPHAAEGLGGGGSVKAVDIFIWYDEVPSEPATALGRSACREVAECEYSRTRGSYKLTWEYGTLEGDPARARAERWHAGYDQCLDVLTRFNARFRGAAGYRGVETRRYLLDWLEANPTRYSCNRRDEICGLTDEQLGNGRILTELLFQLAQDCRNAYLNCSCFGCETDAGVPLARVWFEKRERHGRERCCIVAVDPYPPFRRPLQPECWPAPLGYVNVGRAIWHRWDEVCTTLADLGVRVTQEEFKRPASPVELEAALRCDLFVRCGEERVAYTVDDGPRGRRVVGFCTAAGAPPPPPPPPPPLCPTVTLDGPSSVPAGEGLFRVTATVTGGDPAVAPTYNWTVSAGTIVGGQGTHMLTLNTMALAANSAVTVTVHVGGYDPSCPTSESRTITISGEQADTRPFDQFGDLRKTAEGDVSEFADENARLDNFAFTLQSEPTSEGHIIVYDDRKREGVAAERAKRAKEYLVDVKGVDASRVLTHDGGRRAIMGFELWLVPRGAAPPPIAATQTREVAPAGAPAPARATKKAGKKSAKKSAKK